MPAWHRLIELSMAELEREGFIDSMQKNADMVEAIAPCVGKKPS
jgi:hypothetical protein